jgi:hypothetical protein
MEGLIVDPMDQSICQLVAGVLQRHYPGHEWLIEADRRKGFIDIRNLDLNGKMGCRIDMGGYATASEIEHLAMQFGGELLERHHVARGAVDHMAMAQLKTDITGNARYDS